MNYTEPHHKDVIVVRDKILAAALFSLDHYALMTHEDVETNKFFCIFAITKRLRQDIKNYYGSEPNVNALKLNEELDILESYIAEYAFEVARRVKDYADDSASNKS